MKKHNESCKQDRKKAGPISLNAAAAGGIERVVALGGALAVASLIAAFSIKKGGKKDSIKDKDKDTTNVAALAPAPATESCAKEYGTGEGLSYVPNESSSTMQKNSCCTNNGTSDAGVAEIETSELVSTESSITLEETTIESESKEDSVVVQQETPVHDAEHESNAMISDHGDIQELSEPVHENENNPTNAVHDERLASLGMELIEITIVDESVHVDAEQPTLQPSSPPKEEENSSISTGEQQEEDSLMQSSFPPPLPPPAAAAEEEVNNSPKESSVSTEEEGEEEEEEEEEDSALQSSFSTEVEEDANGENAAELDEESSEGTWSSSQEPNMEVIWPAEIMAFISSAPKEVNLSDLESEMKAIEDGKPTKGEPNHYSDRNRFNRRDNNDGRNNKETGEPAVMDVRKQHATKRQTWFWLGLAVLVLALLANCLLQSNYISNNISFAFPMK
ncbi:hypothetical protein V6N12_011560 [Hibiscus sabdariffa]|uniref:Uncharacterized protein n=1 Tax=Hibiscus sabdariffa TaxID=183260 RepID=A0ABR2AYV0_9ROSI